MSSKSNVSSFLCLICFIVFLLINLEMGEINIALVQMGKSLRLTSSQLPWIMSINMLVFASLMVAAGKFGDNFGYKKVAGISTLVIIAGQICCFISSSFLLLLIGRGIEGAGASAILPCLLVMILDYFEDNKGLGCGLIATIGGLSLILGPIIGAMFSQYLSWRTIFLINPALLTAPAIIFLMNSKAETSGEKESTDFAGILFLASSTVFLLLGISSISNIEKDAQMLIVFFGLFVVSCVLFYYFETRVKKPLIDFNVLKEYPQIPIGCLIRFFSSGIFYIIFYVVGVVFQARHVSALKTSFYLMPMAVIIAVSSPFIGKIMDKSGVRKLVLLAALLMVVSSALLFMFLVVHSWIPYFAGAVLAGLMYSIMNTGTLKYTLSGIPEKVQGTISGLLYMFGIIPATVFMTLAGVILTFNKTHFENAMHIYHASFRENMLLCFFLGLIGAILIVFFMKDQNDESGDGEVQS